MILFGFNALIFSYCNKGGRLSDTEICFYYCDLQLHRRVYHWDEVVSSLRLNCDSIPYVFCRVLRGACHNLTVLTWSKQAVRWPQSPSVSCVRWPPISTYLTGYIRNELDRGVVHMSKPKLHPNPTWTPTLVARLEFFATNVLGLLHIFNFVFRHAHTHGLPGQMQQDVWYCSPPRGDTLWGPVLSGNCRCSTFIQHVKDKVVFSLEIHHVTKVTHRGDDPGKQLPNHRYSLEDCRISLHGGGLHGGTSIQNSWSTQHFKQSWSREKAIHFERMEIRRFQWGGDRDLGFIILDRYLSILVLYINPVDIKASRAGSLWRRDLLFIWCQRKTLIKQDDK